MAMVELNEAVTAELNARIQPKLAEVGWSTGGTDDGALAEYIILMLSNGKTQEEIAAELSGDLLNLGPDDPGAKEFARWLFEQAHELIGQGNGAAQQGQQDQNGQQQYEDAMDTAMGDAQETGGLANAYATLRPKIQKYRKLTIHRPTGPKSMRSGNGSNVMNTRGRDKRMLGQLQRTLGDRGSVLNRVRTHSGNERINTHNRAVPTGPRGGMMNMQQQQRGRFGAMNGMQSGPGAAPMVTPEQQMAMFQMMSQMFTPEQQAAMGMAGGPMAQPFGGQGRGNGRSMFDRTGASNRQQNFRDRQAANGQNGHTNPKFQKPAGPVNPLDMELTPAREPVSTDSTCRYNLACTNKDCKFAHQSPEAPPGTAIDTSDVCAFGAACKNRKCTGRHPSPALKLAHNAEQDCKYFPNCTNPRCPFRHPSAPLCRNGADCKDEGCKFTHVQTKCRFNPCMNPSCQFKHEEGQKRGKFEDKVWVAPGLGGHTAERKFVADEDKPEELIGPSAGNQQQQDHSMGGEQQQEDVIA